MSQIYELIHQLAGHVVLPSSDHSCSHCTGCH